ncbi:gliding motility protein GldN [Dysgonomonas sp. 511]|uniref:type IX secretion system ring protein PorN/GldN n=1 Tax=Dysgonomonas sp. 511 TaxID=2302930 RepID=UPI0013D5A4FF|nr:gliding motility protein GldN [Dysgonomonas sp. 511]NDV79005.1 gliding motility protein GldN [Dysgonomonas sp. 511]
MKRLYYILVIIFCCLSVGQAYAQEQGSSLRDRLAKKQQQAQGENTDTGIKVPKVSVRAQMKNVENNQDLSNATWKREVYRFLDLTKGKNAALYYPVQPIEKQMNLYTMIFKLMGDGNLVAYDWNNCEPLFNDKMKVDFGNVLRRLEIPYQVNGNAFAYDEYSIPSNEALGYYVKEAWYFDQSNSVVGVKTIAICPVLFRQDFLDGLDMDTPGAGLREPQFWINYEDIRPYVARMPIMISDLNNVLNNTIDDYFRLRLYEGEIFKTTNMENKFLSQKYPDPEALKAAQEKIEGELNQFDKSLWVINDSIKAMEIKQHQAAKSKTKTPKAKKSKASKSSGSSRSSGATYSARDRR